MSRSNIYNNRFKPSNRLNFTSSIKGMLLFVIAFAVVGGSYKLWRSFAATPASSSNPHGVYIADFFSAPTASNLSNPNIDGYFQGFKWNLCEPSAGVFRWNSAGCSIDGDLTAVRNTGKQVTLGIDTGSYTPSWAEPKSLNFIISAHNGKFGKCHNDTIPIPWDSTYQSNLHNFINQLQAHLKSVGLYNTVSQVKLTGITEDTEETRMPAETPQACKLPDGTSSSMTNAPQLWAQNGYTQGKVEAAWETMAGYWATAFPDKILGNPTIRNMGFPNIVNGEVQPGTPSTTQDLVKYGASHWGSRYLLMENALSDTSTEPMASFALTNHLPLSIGFQLEDIRYGQAAGANGIPEPAEPAFHNAIVNGVKFKMSYLEIFPNDTADYTAGVAYAHSVLSPTTTNPTCPSGQTGVPPHCVTPTTAKCPSGQTGTPPHCVSSKSGSSTGAAGTTSSSSSCCITTSADSNTSEQIGLPSGTDLSTVSSVTYALDGKVLAVETTAPFTYDLNTGKLGNGCHTLTTTVLNKNSTQTITTKTICVKHPVKWYNHTAINITISIILLAIGGLTVLLLLKPGLRTRLLGLVHLR